MESLVRISATGTDGVGKDTVWRISKQAIPSDLRIVKIGKPSSIILGGREEFVDQQVSAALDRLHTKADESRNRHLTSAVNALIIMFQWRYQEPRLIRRYNPDVVFSLRDGYADPAAYAPYYTPESLGALPIPQRLAYLRRLHGSPYRDHTIFLDVDPEVAVARIDERIAQEAISGERLVRPKWRHQHENNNGLREIRAEFFRVLEVLQEEGTAVTYIDTTGVSPHDVSEQFVSTLMPLVG